MTDDQEQELLETAMEYFPDAVDLAVKTNDDDLFSKVLKKAHEILISKTLSGLIDKGLVEMSGVDGDGEFYFSLTEKGKQAAEGILNDTDSGTEPED